MVGSELLLIYVWATGLPSVDGIQFFHGNDNNFRHGIVSSAEGSSISVLLVNNLTEIALIFTFTASYDFRGVDISPSNDLAIAATYNSEVLVLLQLSECSLY